MCAVFVWRSEDSLRELVLSPLCGSREWNSDPQAGQQMPFPANRFPPVCAWHTVVSRKHVNNAFSTVFSESSSRLCLLCLLKDAVFTLGWTRYPDNIPH